MKKLLHRLALKIRNRHLFLGDMVIGVLTPPIVLLLRLESIEIFLLHLHSLAVFTGTALVWKLAILYSYGMYRHEWRYASVEEWTVVAKATFSIWAAGIFFFFCILGPTGVIASGFPFSVPAVDGVVTALLVSGLRFTVRLAFYLSIVGENYGARRRVLIVGAGVAGSMIVREVRTNPRLNLEPVGFVDDDPEKQGECIHGVRVHGPLRDIPMILVEYNIDEVVIAMPTAPGKVIREVVQTCAAARVPSKTVPGIFEILGGSAKVSELREVRVEDLLRRGIVKNETDGVIPLVQGRRVMVTGAGGSIGSELCKQICALRPSVLVLLGHGENSIFHVAAELQRQFLDGNREVKINTVIADLRDNERMTHVFQTQRPEIIFHAAAHKHVGLMEKNFPDAVTNNILGTQILVDLADQFAVERFILISSDKAVNPTCIMGVTKRVAELIVHDAAMQTGRAFVTVRFGNVLGSRGSVVPIFKRQIELGGPITITDPEVTRFFMTIPEAVQLVLKAAELGNGGEVFVLDMGQPIKIVSLAHDLIRLSGLEVGKDIDIVYTGLKPGEKLSEELFYASEKTERTNHEKILVAANGASTRSCISQIQQGLPRALQSSPSELTVTVERLINAAREDRLNEIRCLLKEIVPEYQTFSDLQENAEVNQQTIWRKETTHLLAAMEH